MWPKLASSARHSIFAPNGRRKDGLELKPKDKLAVTLMASDRCDLADAPERRQRRSISARRRDARRTAGHAGTSRAGPPTSAGTDHRRTGRDAGFGQPRQTRGGRCARRGPGRQPGNRKCRPRRPKRRKVRATQTAEEREQSLRSLRTQRAVVQGQKSAQEVLGVAASFDDIREELINNRVDSEDRKVRLQGTDRRPLAADR